MFNNIDKLMQLDTCIRNLKSTISFVQYTYLIVRSLVGVFLHRICTNQFAIFETTPNPSKAKFKF